MSNRNGNGKPKTCHIHVLVNMETGAMHIEAPQDDMFTAQILSQVLAHVTAQAAKKAAEEKTRNKIQVAGEGLLRVLPPVKEP